MSNYTGTENLEIMTEAVNYNNFLVSLVQKEISQGDVVVDFGAGIGTFAETIVANGHEIHCIELDEQQRARIKAVGIPASADLSDLGDNSIDLLYTFNVLEHIENDVDALTLCYEKINIGGRILIYVPAFQIIYSSMDKKVGHYRRYTRNEIAEKVRSVGFEVISNEYVDSIGFFASLIFKFIGNDNGTINRNALVFYDNYVFPLSRSVDKIFNKIFGKNVLLIAKKL